MVNEQRAQAAQEAAKEAARQQRLQTGLASIKSAFEGSPVMAPAAYDWSSFKAPEAMPAAMSQWLAANPNTAAPDFSQTGSAPAGYKAVQIPGAAPGGAPAVSPTGRMNNPNAGFQAGASAANPSGAGGGQFYGGQYATATPGAGASAKPTEAGGAGGSAWGLQDASGKLYRQGDALTVQSPTGATTGGFDDAFYNKYKQSVLDYYMPQVQDQYKKAQEQATYGLGRSGNLRSSAANTLVADLAKQNAINEAGVRNQADTAAGDLRSQVSTERQKATSQLYATEDPEIAAQQSLAAVRDISLRQPDLSPLSALFNVATIGGANLNRGFQAQRNLNTFTGALPKDKSRNVGLS